MTALAKLEDKLAHQYKRLPQLPGEITKFLYSNAWWLFVIYGALTVIDLFSALRVLHTSQVLHTYYGWFYDGATAESLAYLTIIVNLIALYWIVKAITPLKERRKAGWDYIYKVALLMTVAGLVTAFWVASSGQFVWALIYGAVSLYLTFSIRPHYVASRAKPATKR